MFRSPQPAGPAKWISPTPATCSHCSTRAIGGCKTGEFAAMVTAPIHKGVINEAFPHQYFPATPNIWPNAVRPRA